jgi:hypothetical protein
MLVCWVSPWFVVVVALLGLSSGGVSLPSCCVEVEKSLMRGNNRGGSCSESVPLWIVVVWNRCPV